MTENTDESTTEGTEESDDQSTEQSRDRSKDQPKKAERQQRRDGQRRRSVQRKSRLSGARAAERALKELYDLTGKEPAGVVGLERTEDGWKVRVETVELRRVPATTDLLATYEVELDSGGELAGYRRLHRYVRGAPDEE